MSKGLSETIVIILLLLITVALGAAAYIWINSVAESATGSGSETIESYSSSAQSLFKIEEAYQQAVSPYKGFILIRNLGNTNLESFSIYIDNTAQTISEMHDSNENIIEKISPRELGFIIFTPNIYGNNMQLKVCGQSGYCYVNKITLNEYGGITPPGGLINR